MAMPSLGVWGSIIDSFYRGCGIDKETTGFEEIRDNSRPAILANSTVGVKGNPKASAN
jgi:hypothetical protein